jgi:uncharacterized protein (TIGR00251 family)
MTSGVDVSKALLQTPEGVVVRVYVQPKARRAQIVGMHADRLKVAVTEPPDRGKANDAVLRRLADSFCLSVSSLELLRGHSSRNKDILIRGLSSTDCAKQLATEVVSPD